MAKVYIWYAYRVVSVHPEDRWLIGMTHKRELELYLDTTLPFSFRLVLKIFTAKPTP